ncbi:MAG: putative ATP-dependent dsDNA exonuclease, partial [Frankiales bacterium]|nr:putative ATP-dependent dsDNA exonuclease [Frankiales bacterium]
MRPHSLRLRAFGPFAEEVVVDLDALAASGLFLLHGETGAGKTTLLDGIGFALYGRVPGVRGKTGRLRSDHADPSVRTEVELEVTLGGRRWRITRSPAQERAKSRGTGTTTEQARVLLEELQGGAWTTVSTRIDEAAAELDPLLGMSADQFFQVVLLPQGEFAQFLRADSGKRGELLQRLFATERFKAVEEWLVARRISTSTEVAAARQELDLLAARLAQAAGVEVPSPVPAEWGPSLLAETNAEVASAQAAVTAATVALTSCREAADQAARLAGLQQRRASALAARQRLEQARPAQDALRVELRTAARAAELVTVLDEAAERQSLAAQAGSAEASARALLAPVGLPVDASLPSLVTAADSARRRSGRLEALRGVADALAEEQGLQRAASAESAAAAAGLREVQVRLVALPEQRAAARADVAAAQAAAERLPVVEAAAAVLAMARTEATGLAATVLRLEQLREEHVLARETLVSLREKENDLREARFVSMVAELADRLEDGAPCEVCGATSHPDPYLGDGESVTRDDEDRARIAAEHAARQVADVEARLAAEAATADGHRARLAATGHADDDLEPLWAELQEALSSLRALAGTLPRCTASLEQLDAAQVTAEAARARIEGELAGA